MAILCGQPQAQQADGSGDNGLGWPKQGEGHPHGVTWHGLSEPKQDEESIMGVMGRGGGKWETSYLRGDG